MKDIILLKPVIVDGKKYFVYVVDPYWTEKIGLKKNKK